MIGWTAAILLSFLAAAIIVSFLVFALLCQRWIGFMRAFMLTLWGIAVVLAFEVAQVALA